MRVHCYSLGTGIVRTPEFEKKRLATHSVNVGTKCGHGCAYCSTGSLLRRHRSFKEVQESPFTPDGYAIVDPTTPERVARDAERIQPRGLVQLCTQVDAWSPEAQAHKLGPRCLQAILGQPDWSVRILTKNDAVVEDFDLVKRHRDRVLVGISITAPPAGAGPVAALEPNASSIKERIAAMTKAHRRGLRTYAMFCPLLPGLGASTDQVNWLVEFAERCGVEEIFVEPVNPRGPGLIHCVENLRRAGFEDHAAQVDAIRNRACWSRYVADLLSAVQASIRRHSDIHKLRFLLYPSRLAPLDRERIERADEGVVWLGKGAVVDSSTTVQEANPLHPAA